MSKAFIPYNELNSEQKALVDSAQYINRITAVQQGFGWDFLIEDEDEFVRTEIAKQRYGLNVLVADPSPVVRSSVAYQGYGLTELLEDKSEQVRQVAEVVFGSVKNNPQEVEFIPHISEPVAGLVDEPATEVIETNAEPVVRNDAEPAAELIETTVEPVAEVVDAAVLPVDKRETKSIDVVQGGAALGDVVVESSFGEDVSETDSAQTKSSDEIESPVVVSTPASAKLASSFKDKSFLDFTTVKWDPGARIMLDPLEKAGVLYDALILDDDTLRIRFDNAYAAEVVKVVDFHLSNPSSHIKEDRFFNLAEVRAVAAAVQRKEAEQLGSIGVGTESKDGELSAKATKPMPAKQVVEKPIPFADLDEEQKKLVFSAVWEDRVKAVEQGWGLDILVNDVDYVVRAAVARQGFGLDNLVNDPVYSVRVAVARQGYGLDVLINDKDELVRAAVAEQGYGLDVLAKDEKAWVRAAVAGQSACLDALAQDSDDWVRGIAVRLSEPQQEQAAPVESVSPESVVSEGVSPDVAKDDSDFTLEPPPAESFSLIDTANDAYAELGGSKEPDDGAPTRPMDR